MTTLKGMTWGHTRGLVPLVATAQRHRERNPEIRIEWSVRSLMDFGEQSIEDLAESFDFLVIDHPFIGQAVKRGIFTPMDALLPADFLADQAAHSVGPSHPSYLMDGHLWALPIDTACPVSHWRPDLLAQAGQPVPATYAQVLDLARQNKVLVPGIHTDAIHNFYMFCHAHGETPFATGERVVSEEVALKAIASLRELMALVPSECRRMNPIHVLEKLSETDEYWYCPFAFGYSTYAQTGYAKRLVASGDLPTLGGKPLMTTLGGAGLAISSRCRHPKLAADYARFVASPDTQEFLYTRTGGQPGHRRAWLSPTTNQDTHGYFKATLPALDRAWLRPRYFGYLHFQDHATHVVAAAQNGELAPAAAVAQLEKLWLESNRQA